MVVTSVIRRKSIGITLETKSETVTTDQKREWSRLSVTRSPLLCERSLSIDQLPLPIEIEDSLGLL